MPSPLVEQQSIDTRFTNFHEQNPQVYTELVTMARQLKDRGYQRIGIELLFAAYRWNNMLKTSADNYNFKLNDHFTSRYARLIMNTEEDLDGFFITRALRTP